MPLGALDARRQRPARPARRAPPSPACRRGRRASGPGTRPGRRPGAGGRSRRSRAATPARAGRRRRHRARARSTAAPGPESATTAADARGSADPPVSSTRAPAARAVARPAQRLRRRRWRSRPCPSGPRPATPGAGARRDLPPCPPRRPPPHRHPSVPTPRWRPRRETPRTGRRPGARLPAPRRSPAIAAATWSCDTCTVLRSGTPSAASPDAVVGRRSTRRPSPPDASAADEPDETGRARVDRADGEHGGRAQPVQLGLDRGVRPAGRLQQERNAQGHRRGGTGQRAGQIAGTGEDGDVGAAEQRPAGRDGGRHGVRVVDDRELPGGRRNRPGRGVPGRRLREPREAAGAGKQGHRQRAGEPTGARVLPSSPGRSRRAHEASLLGPVRADERIGGMSRDRNVGWTAVRRAGTIRDDVIDAAQSGQPEHRPAGRRGTRILVVTPGAVEKHTQHIVAKLGLAPDEDQHRRVLATLAYLRG